MFILALLPHVFCALSLANQVHASRTAAWVELNWEYEIYDTKMVDHCMTLLMEVLIWRTAACCAASVKATEQEAASGGA